MIGAETCTIGCQALPRISARPSPIRGSESELCGGAQGSSAFRRVFRQDLACACPAFFRWPAWHTWANGSPATVAAAVADANTSAMPLIALLSATSGPFRPSHRGRGGRHGGHDRASTSKASLRLIVQRRCTTSPHPSALRRAQIGEQSVCGQARSTRAALIWRGPTASAAKYAEQALKTGVALPSAWFRKADETAPT